MPRDSGACNETLGLLQLRFQRRLFRETATPNSYAFTRWLLLRLRTSQLKYASCRDPKSRELFEAFEASKQVGSSTMPHKQNPETCERVCGLARIVRSLSTPALEDMITWHERDLTQSSAERFILPESNILLDYMLSLMCNIVANLRVDKQRMLQNLSLTQGSAMSEAVMMALTKKGVNRQEAHEIAEETDNSKCHWKNGTSSKFS